MDSLFTILFIAVFIILSVRQDRKNKKRQEERAKRMVQEMEQDENFGMEEEEEVETTPTFPTLPTMPTAQQMAERHAELRRQHERMLAEIRQSQQTAKQYQPKVQPTETTIPKSPKPPGNKGANTPPKPPATTSQTFDFDIERAVVEAEILRPKYLDY